MNAHINWRGVVIEVLSEANWLDSGLTHIEVVALPRTPLPITQTGYRSHFIDPGDLAEYAGVEDFVLHWLDAAAENWDAQLPLF